MGKLSFDKDTSKDAEKKLKKDFAKEFGKYVRKVRNDASLSQEELAHQVHIHSTYIGHIETGRYTPSMFVIWKIAQVLKMDLKELLKGF